MRRRDLLHHTKVDEFIKFAESKGYASEDTKGEYEVFRLRINNRLYIGHKRDRTDHITFHSDKIDKLFYEFKHEQN